MLVLIAEIKHARIQALALRTKTVMTAPDQLRIINKNIFENSNLFFVVKSVY